MKWYRKAAEQGLANAQFALGNMYEQGRGVPQNTSEALQWLRKAEVQGQDKATETIQSILQEQLNQPQHQQTAAEAPPSLIPIGARVELRGLQAKPELNGRRRGQVRISSGRCRVQLDDGGEGFFQPKGTRELIHCSLASITLHATCGVRDPAAACV